MPAPLSPQLTMTDQICRKLAPLYRREFGEVERMQTKGDSARIEAMESLKKIELAAAKEIKRSYPNTPIVIRNLAPIPDKGPCWALHMTGGLENFLHGLAPVAMLFLYLRDGKAFSGMVYFPIEDELYTVEKGATGTGPIYRLRVNAAKELRRGSIVSVWSTPEGRQEGKVVRHGFQPLVLGSQIGVRVSGNPLYDLLQLAAGKVDGFAGEFLSPEMNLFADLLVREAGGKITDIDGKDITKDSTTIIASNVECHAQLLKFFSEGCQGNLPQ